MAKALKVRKKKNVVQSWIDAVTDEGRSPLRPGLDQLAKDTGYSYTHSRISEMADGARSVSPSAYNSMFPIALAHVLRTEGIELPPNKLKEVAERLGGAHYGGTKTKRTGAKGRRR